LRASIVAAVLACGLSMLPAASATATDGSGGTTTPADPEPGDPTPSDPPAPPASPPPPTPAGPLRLMVAGDSLSQEFSGDYTWRWRLDQEFKRQRVPVEFVGPRRGAWGPIPFSLVPWSGDRHAALGGTTLALQRNRIRSDVATYRPDVALVMIGFNDLNHGATPSTVVASMDTYLQNVWAARPDTRVVLAPILSSVVYPTSRVRALPISTVNAGYAALVRKYAGQGRSITSGSTGATWSPRSHTTDGVHPNSTGETVIAQRYAATLHALRVLPRAPSLVRSVTWAPQARATVTQRPRRMVRISWAYYKQRLTMGQGRVLIQGGHLERPKTVTGGQGVVYRDVRLGPGRYTVRLAPIRKWMVGSYGPAVGFRVR
jgi:lysophospholipase L1-like esterase